MKATLLILILGLIRVPNDDGQATVKTIQGVKIFIYSEPSQDFEIIDSGKVMLTLTGTCNDRIQQAANKAAKLKANGLIIEMGEPTRWTAIRFK